MPLFLLITLFSRQAHRRYNRTHARGAAAAAQVHVRTRPWEATKRPHDYGGTMCTSVGKVAHRDCPCFHFQWRHLLSSLLWGVSSRFALMGTNLHRHVTLALGPTFGPSSPMDDGTYRQGPTWLHRYLLLRLQMGVEIGVCIAQRYVGDTLISMQDER